MPEGDTQSAGFFDRLRHSLSRSATRLTDGLVVFYPRQIDDEILERT